ncbi:RNA ligase (ATP) [Zooshikella sp. RANM57]|uniref:RNA ligase (ATP) n=1 Tax=Zooshikella sp. RANM57 TaxID=3425863 RepID=UPI003D6FF4B9
MRKLVTVRKVDAISPIPNADAIECATVEGWTVVIKKNEFSVNDPCVFFEIDSFLPIEDERFSFLAKNKITWQEKEGIRLRTLKLRGQLSQGLILPLAAFPEIMAQIDGAELADIRDHDFSGLLNIEKWEAPVPACLMGEVHGGFPGFIRKTDQERIQNLPDVFVNELNSLFEVTVKLDGSSMTVFHNDSEIGVCGRNWWLKETPENSLWKVARASRLIDSLSLLGKNIALQGELIGEGIQGNPEKLKGQAFYVFDAYDIDAQCYLGHYERHLIMDELRAYGAQLEQVPHVAIDNLRNMGSDLATLLSMADGPSLNPNTRREGLVFKKINGQLSFKVISNYYLLKYSNK